MNIVSRISTYYCRIRFIRALCGQLNDFSPAQLRLLRRIINDQSRLLLQNNQSRFKDYQSNVHLSLATVAIASYSVLSPMIHDENRLLAVLTASFCDFYRASGLPLWINIQLRFSGDPYKLLLSTFKAKSWLRLAFGKSFVFDVQEESTEFTFEVRRCLYNDTLKAHNLPQLIPIFCAADDQWSRTIRPEKHGVSFKRPTVLANGGDMCRFKFVRSTDQKSQ